MKLKITIASVAVVALLLFFGGRFINAVQEDEWKIQRAAVQTAYQKTLLTKADKVERFVGDKPYTVIHGENKIGQKMIVWVGEEELFAQMASDGVTEEQIEAQVEAKHPEADLLRAMPGVLNGALIWEAFYKLPADDSGDERYYYDYYTFKEGTLLDTYRLSIQ
ncbi:DUF5590 domain-containing protein [Paenibacillus doosanensis]|uniref:Cell wall elongation regulator TseB-like domain-containing protein n=1 Tax=Paenibacillus konkukensis TaxID=2020716 RepID=A0ABY4RI99_9BACL|nr:MULTISPECIES: DUF5590 domain-containing protein [Paenibacillus]MCS7462515.1 DUF5590 domain-containing protein [Paenibacillus doosanensis]UQZ81878.1 hypothetical protein SK3146_01034 [Paenibacillus konkukensis]